MKNHKDQQLFRILNELQTSIAHVQELIAELIKYMKMSKTPRPGIGHMIKCKVRSQEIESTSFDLRPGLGKSGTCSIGIQKNQSKNPSKKENTLPRRTFINGKRKR